MNMQDITRQVREFRELGYSLEAIRDRLNHEWGFQKDRPTGLAGFELANEGNTLRYRYHDSTTYNLAMEFPHLRVAKELSVQPTQVISCRGSYWPSGWECSICDAKEKENCPVHKAIEGGNYG